MLDPLGYNNYGVSIGPGVGTPDDNTMQYLEDVAVKIAGWVWSVGVALCATCVCSKFLWSKNFEFAKNN